MNLTRRLPNAVMVGGVRYPIRTGFRSWVRFDAILTESDLPYGERLALALSAVLIEKTLPKDLGGLLAALFDFYACGAQKSGKGKKGGGRVLSFTQDAPLIYAAILSQYGVDLTRQNPHWYAFCAMLCGLDADCTLSKIMGYRSVNLSDITDKTQRSYLKKMKARYKLSETRTQTEIERDTADALSRLM